MAAAWSQDTSPGRLALSGPVPTRTSPGAEPGAIRALTRVFVAPATCREPRVSPAAGSTWLTWTGLVATATSTTLRHIAGSPAPRPTDTRTPAAW